MIVLKSTQSRPPVDVIGCRPRNPNDSAEIRRRKDVHPRHKKKKEKIYDKIEFKNAHKLIENENIIRIKLKSYPTLRNYGNNINITWNKKHKPIDITFDYNIINDIPLIVAQEMAKELELAIYMISKAELLIKQIISTIKDTDPGVIIYTIETNTSKSTMSQQDSNSNNDVN